MMDPYKWFIFSSDSNEYNFFVVNYFELMKNFFDALKCNLWSSNYISWCLHAFDHISGKKLNYFF